MNRFNTPCPFPPRVYSLSCHTFTSAFISPRIRPRLLSRRVSVSIFLYPRIYLPFSLPHCAAPFFSSMEIRKKNLESIRDVDRFSIQCKESWRNREGITERYIFQDSWSAWNRTKWLSNGSLTNRSLTKIINILQVAVNRFTFHLCKIEKLGTVSFCSPFFRNPRLKGRWREAIS